MKFCSECGKRFEKTVRFCPSCGVELKEITDNDKVLSIPANQNTSDKKKGIKLTPVQNMIVVVVIIILGIGGYMYKSPEQQVRRVIDDYMSVVVLNSQLENPQVEDLKKAIEYVSGDVAQSYMKEIEETYSKKDDKEHKFKMNSDPFHFYYYKVRNWDIKNISLMNDRAIVHLYIRNYVDYPGDSINEIKIITMENRVDKWCITAIENEKESGEKNE